MIDPASHDAPDAASPPAGTILPDWLQLTLPLADVVVITSSLTETKPIEVLAEQHNLSVHFETMSMGSTLNRDRFNALCKTIGRKQLPLIFYRCEFIGGYYELDQLLSE